MSQLDPYQAAMEAKEPPQIIFGEVLLDLYFCVLEKGVGKVVFDPGRHSTGQRRTCVKIGVYPLVETGLTFAMEREFIAEIASDGWLKVTLPSLRDDLHVTDLQTIKGAFAQVEMITFGSYVKDGETKNKTAPKFLALYPDQDTCLAAYDQSQYARAAADNEGVSNEELHDQILGTPPNASATNGAANGAERNTAVAFLPAIIRTCMHDGNPNKGVDIAKLESQIKSNALLAKYFTIDSPEVIQAVNQAVTDPAF